MRNELCESKGDSRQLYLTWLNFIEQGVIQDQEIKPHIIRSWQRSKNIDPSIDPTKSKFVLSGKQLEAKRAENKDLILLANPIIQNICSMCGENFVLLCGSDGYVLEAVSNVDYPLPLGAKCREEDIGTNAIGTALVENDLVEIKGCEHYSACLHTNNCMAIPIHDPKGEIIGVINISNPYGDLVPGTAGLLRLGVQVIERQLQWKKYHARQKDAVKSFEILKDNIKEYMLIFNQSGKIIDANQNFINLYGAENVENILEVHFRDIFKDESNLSTISTYKPYLPGSKLQLVVDKCALDCTVIKNQIINDHHGRYKSLILFELVKPNKAKDILKKPFFTFDDIIGNTTNWSLVVSRAEKAAKVLSNVLISGESGTGKELIAQAIHAESGRSGPFIPINCGAIPKELIESELFGYEDGAFTGARKGGSKGKFETADGGTVFLDEIGEMSLLMQVRLLRFLQDRVVTRIGGTKPKKVDVRIIAATNRDLWEEIKQSRFREDLYFRLNVISIQLTPLRERKEDIPILVRHFKKKFCQQFQKPPMEIDDETLQILCRYGWPGNVRELSNVIENAVVFTDDSLMLPESLPSYINEHLLISLNKNKNLKKYENQLILDTLEKYQGNMTKTAKALGIARNTLYNKIRVLKE